MHAQVSSGSVSRPFASLLAAIALFATLAAQRGVAASAAVSLPAGTTLHAVLRSSDLNTENARVGNPVSFTVVEPYPNASTAFSGAVIHAHVADVQSAGQGRKASMRIGFDSITLRDGRTGSVSGEITALKSTAEDTTARKALGAGVGMAVGSQTIGRMPVIGGLGTVGGAAAGYMYASNAKANFNVATGAQATIRTTESTELRQAH